jgi:hypothetical protein
MAGVKAGGRGLAFELEMIMDLERLTRDARQAQEIMKGMGGAMSSGMSDADRAVANAGVSMSRLRREAQALKDQIDPLGPVQRRHVQELRSANAMLATGMINQRQYGLAVEFAELKLDEQTAAIQRNIAAANVASASIGRTGTASKFARHHLMNLGFQANDLGVQMMMAAQSSDPLRMGLTALVQQGSQVAGIMSQANAGVGDLAKLIGSTALRFAPLLAVLGSFAGALKIVTDDINENSTVTVTWGDVMLGTFDAVKSFVSTEVGGAFKALGIDIGEVWQWTADASKKWANFVIGTAVAVPTAIIESWKYYPSAIAEVLLYAANGAISIFETWINNFISGINMALGLVKSVTGLNLGGLGNVSLGRIENNFVGSFSKMGKQTAKAFVGSYKDYIGAGIEFISPFVEARARERLAKDAKKAGKDAGKAGGKAMADEWIKKLAKEFDNAFKPELDQMKALEAVWGDNAKIREQIEALQREAKVLHLTGVERERVLTLLEQEAELRPILARIGELENEIRRTGNDGLWDEVRALQQKIDLIKQRNQLKIDNADDVARIEATREALERQNDALREMAQLLGNIGGFAGVLGKVFNFLGGDYAGVGGTIGGLLNTIVSYKTGDDGKQIAVRIGDQMRDIFGANGVFGQTLTSALQSAGIGIAAGSAITGNSGTGSQIGGALGGMLGKLGGKALAKGLTSTLTSTLGSTLGGAVGTALPVIGTILGGVLGSAIGGLFKSTKWARADVSGVSDADLRYRSNSGKYEDAVSGAAKGVVDGLKSIAEQLGGVAGEFGSIAIGVRDGNYRVNANGKSLKTSAGAKDFGEDSAAAIAYAIQVAVQRGAITGINQSVLNLLQASGDFETQLSKAAELQNIFAEIAQSANPMGYELEQLAKKFASVNALLAEANATPEEVQQVADYQAQQEAAIRARYAAEAAARQAAIDEKTAELLALQGKATLALNKSRAAELAQMDATTAAIQKQIYIEQDAATKRALWIELLEAQGNAEAAKLAQRDEVMRATLDENKATQQRIWLLQDLSSAYSTESQALQDTADKMKGLSATLREFRDTIYAGDESALSYTQALAKWIKVQSLAATGDETAIGNIAGTGRDFLDAARASARTMLDYQRAQALVANGVDQVLGYTDDAASVAEQQLTEMQSMVGQFITLNETAQSVEQALEKLVAFNAASATSAPAETYSSANARTDRIEKGLNSLGEQLSALLSGSTRATRASERLLDMFKGLTPDGLSLRISTDPDDPIKADVVS